jgi:hypothetical protein
MDGAMTVQTDHAEDVNADLIRTYVRLVLAAGGDPPEARGGVCRARSAGSAAIVADVTARHEPKEAPESSSIVPRLPLRRQGG